MKEILRKISNSDRGRIIARNVIEIAPPSFGNNCRWNWSPVPVRVWPKGKMLNFSGTGSGGKEGNIRGKGEIKGMNGFRG